MTLSGYHTDLLNDSPKILHWFTQWLLPTIALIYSMTPSGYHTDLLNESLWLLHWFTQWILPTRSHWFTQWLSFWLLHWFTQGIPSTIALIYSMTCFPDYCIDVINDSLPWLSDLFTSNPSKYCTDLLNESLPWLSHWSTQWLPLAIAMIASMTPFSDYLAIMIPPALLNVCYHIHPDYYFPAYYSKWLPVGPISNNSSPQWWLSSLLIGLFQLIGELPYPPCPRPFLNSPSPW
jgi:hypothetical protein